MQVSNPNDIKIYNLSVGKSLPEVFVPFFPLKSDNRLHNYFSGFLTELKETLLKEI